MRKIYSKRNIALITVAAFAGISIYSVNGPGGTFGANVTGAPFDGNDCTSCHAPGSNYGATVSLQLFSGASAVTSYVPGNSYTLRITRSAPSLTAVNGGFGFQATCATSGTNINIDNWGTLPANVTSVNVNGRDYVEHTAKFPKATTQVNLPWTAPSTGTGSVVFYLALNTVNGNGNNSGDQVLTTSLTVAETPLPLTWLYFKGRENENGQVLLEWAAANEQGNDFYTLEKSRDGKSYSQLGIVDAGSKNGSYSYTDPSPFENTYYRIKQTDLSGKSEYYKTVQVQTLSDKKATHYIQGSNIVVELFSKEAKSVIVSVFNISSNLVEKTEVQLKQGRNRIELLKPATAGIYFLNVTSASEKIYTGKLIIM